MTNIADIEKLINILSRRKQKLKEQEAYYGPRTNPEILMEIEDVEGQIEKLRTELEVIVETKEFDTKPILTKDFSFLRQWKPNHEPNGFGVDILLESNFRKEEIILFIEFITRDFIKYLDSDKEPILIRLWKTQIAHEQNENKVFRKEFREGYIAFYVKNLNGKGAYSGFNEIRWMQEIGEFSDLFGQVTKC